MQRPSRTGIFAGTFDPVHNGHLAFARTAIQACQLDTVVFLPEREPRYKRNVTDIDHRLAMLHLAITDEPNMQVLALPEPHFSVDATLPTLTKMYNNHALFLLAGSDVAMHIPSWPGGEELQKAMTIVVGQRTGEQQALPPDVVVVSTGYTDITSSAIRTGDSQAVSPKVAQYIADHHLYGIAKTS